MKQQHSLKIYIQSYPDRIATQLIKSYSDVSFSSSTPFLGLEIITKKIERESFDINITFFHEPLIGLTLDTKASNFRGTNAAFLFFNKDTLKSFENISEIFYNFRKITNQENIPVFILGIISDFEAISSKRAENLANKLGTQYFETPSDNFYILDHIIQLLINRYISRVIPVCIISHPDEIAANFLNNYTDTPLEGDLTNSGRIYSTKEFDPSTKLTLTQITSNRIFIETIKPFIKESQALMYIYSKSSRESFENIIRIHEELLGQKNEIISFFLAVTNRSAVVSTEEGLLLETRFNSQYFESDSNDHKFFTKIMNSLIHKVKHLD